MLVLISLTVVAELVGVNNKFKLPVEIDTSNDPNDEPVKISPYCAIFGLVPSCITINSITW
jgi:hypothetical protein